MIYILALITIPVTILCIFAEAKSMQWRKLQRKAAVLAIYTKADGIDRSVEFALREGISIADARGAIYTSPAFD